MFATKWFSVRPARALPALRLFCFPHVGAGASAFNLWQPAWIPDNIELWTVRLPGREQRLSETPFRNMGPLVEALYEAMATQLNGPYAFYGHSLGALVAFEMARKIQRQGGPGPIRLLVSAHTAPQLDCPISAFGGIDDADVSQADLAAWKTHTSQEFSFQMMEGDHFFIFRSADFPRRLFQELKGHQEEAIKR